jgi:FkbM family methyltransferase
MELNTSTILNNLENVNFNQKLNGEENYLSKLKDLSFNIIFDVGANTGEWSKMARRNWTKAEIHAFEILPKHCKVLSANLQNLDIIINEFGLSEASGNIEVHYNNTSVSDSQATIYPQFIIKSERQYYDSVCECIVRRGDEYVSQNKISAIDLLKIDVEGHELKVIKSFGDFITKVRLIQFEYGVYNITSKDLLCDFFGHLERYGFVIGRLYPHFVDFFEYEYSREKFMGGNYIAIKKNDFELMSLLKKF